MPVGSSAHAVARPALLIVGIGVLLAGLVAAMPASAALPRHQASTPTPTLPPGTGGVAGTAWDDLDGNGFRDAGEPPLAGVLVTVQGQGSPVTASDTTGAAGSYRLAGLQPGIYRLAATPPPGYVLTTPGGFDIFVGAGTVLTLDFGALFVPTPTPTPTEPPLLDTSQAVQVYCGGVYQGDTRGGRNNVSRYGCRPAWNESGPEQVFRIELSQSQPLSASLLWASADLDLFLLPYVYPDSCVAAGDNGFALDVEPGVYFLAVDGYQGAAGEFGLRLQCPLDVQATLTPTPIPSPTPTPTMTHTPGPTATPTATRTPQPSYLPLMLRTARSSSPGR